MLEEMLGKKIKVVLDDSYSDRSLHGILIFEDDYCIKIELRDRTIFAINKDKIVSVRLFKEDENYG